MVRFHRSLTIPLWALALCAAALFTPLASTPLLTVTIALAMIVWMTMATFRWGRSADVLGDLQAAVSCVALAGATRPAHPDAPVAGTREAGMLTTFATSVVEGTLQDEPSSMDAVTIAERQREGGGAPSQRRPARPPWSARQRLHRYATAAGALFIRRFRIKHV